MIVLMTTSPIAIDQSNPVCPKFTTHLLLCGLAILISFFLNNFPLNRFFSFFSRMFVSKRLALLMNRHPAWYGVLMNKRKLNMIHHHWQTYPPMCVDRNRNRIYYTPTYFWKMRVLNKTLLLILFQFSAPEGQYNGVRDVFRHLMKEEGIRAMYKVCGVHWWEFHGILD